MTTRIHFAEKAFALEQHPYLQELAMKPSGLWYSVEGNGDGWSHWTAAEQWRETSEQVGHVVDLDLSRVLVLGESSALLGFEKEYGRPHSTADRGSWEYIYRIDWTLVATRYAGIEIAPYQWQHRHDAMWYYGWDCASGCVWDVDAIRSFEPVGAPGAVAPDVSTSTGLPDGSVA